LRIDQRGAFDMNGRVIDYAEVMARAGRNACPRLIYQWDTEGLLGVEQLRKLLPDAWTGPEFPARALPHWYWVDLFRRAGFISDTLIEIREVTTIYRGAVRRWRKGMSWTVDLDKARWFAERNAHFFHKPARVYAAEIAREDVLAIFFTERPGEAEVAVAPGGLRNIRALSPIVKRLR
jgi:hypothetical protein